VAGRLSGHDDQSGTHRRRAFEDCHTSDDTPVPIVLVVSKIVTCPQRSRAYTRLQYVFVGIQTVSLGC
jgi:hypothetical protein